MYRDSILTANFPFLASELAATRPLAADSELSAPGGHLVAHFKSNQSYCKCFTAVFKMHREVLFEAALDCSVIRRGKSNRQVDFLSLNFNSGLSGECDSSRHKVQVRESGFLVWRVDCPSLYPLAADGAKSSPRPQTSGRGQRSSRLLRIAQPSPKKSRPNNPQRQRL